MTVLQSGAAWGESMQHDAPSSEEPEPISPTHAPRKSSDGSRKAPKGPNPMPRGIDESRGTTPPTLDDVKALLDAGDVAGATANLARTAADRFDAPISNVRSAGP